MLLVLDRLLNRGSGAQMIAVDATTSEPRVAILPFADMSAEKDQDYFCEEPRRRSSMPCASQRPAGRLAFGIVQLKNARWTLEGGASR